MFPDGRECLTDPRGDTYRAMSSGGKNGLCVYETKTQFYYLNGRIQSNHKNPNRPYQMPRINHVHMKFINRKSNTGTSTVPLVLNNWYTNDAIRENHHDSSTDNYS